MRGGPLSAAAAPGAATPSTARLARELPMPAGAAETAASASSRSSTLRANRPAVSSDADVGSTPASGSTPKVGLKPSTPQ